MKRNLLMALACGLLVGRAMAAAPGQGWLLRVRAVNLDPANCDSTPLGLAIDRKTIPEVDRSYHLSPQVAVELVLTRPQKQQIRAGGTRIGDLKHLPPTLTRQYHCLPGGDWQPYVGIGLNWTRFSAVHLPAPYTIDQRSVGPALQAGFDVPLAPNLVFNVDVKTVQIRTDVFAAGVKGGEFRIDPGLFGVGLGWRF